ncbi:hypothetical protein BVX98_04620, partial [bacterium F11]
MNMDGDHANVWTFGVPFDRRPLYERFPDLQKLYWGKIYNRVDPNKVIVGNASVHYGVHALDGTLVSVVRGGAMRSQEGADTFYNHYINNHAFWYPEAQDHDLIDRFHAMTPTVNVSQGSSGSEEDEVDRWFQALDAFDSATKIRLKETKLLMPTIQMISRRVRVNSDEEYLSHLAHPSAFDGTYYNSPNTPQNETAEAIRLTTATREMAGEMTANTIPPMIQLKVIEENFGGHVGVDFFIDQSTYTDVIPEKAYTTPVSISRIWRGREYTKRMVVSAEDSYDANGRTLTEYRWVVLRGDENHVRITPLNPEHTRVAIEIDYHTTAPIPDSFSGGTPRISNMVVIGIFVHNGVYYSAPAFITSHTLAKEERTYDVPNKRLTKIRYTSDHYTAKYLMLNKTWDTDTYYYDTNGDPLGWIRQRGADNFSFTKEGFQVIDGDIFGEVRQVQRVRYQKSRWHPTLTWVPLGDPFIYGEPDTTPPNVSFIIPEQGDEIRGTSWNIIVSATDNWGIDQIELFIGNISLGVQDSSPANFIFDTTTFPDGTYTLRSEATDRNTNVGSQAINITIRNTPITMVPQWGRFEVVLHDDIPSGNPFDVELWGEFTSPSGRTLKQLGFYAGDGTWKIYFMPDEDGDWSYTTFSPENQEDGDPDLIGDGDLNGQEGEFRAYKSYIEPPLERGSTEETKNQWVTPDGTYKFPLIWAVPHMWEFRAASFDDWGGEGPVNNSSIILDEISQAKEAGAQWLGIQSLVLPSGDKSHYFSTAPAQQDALPYMIGQEGDKFHIPFWNNLNDKLEMARWEGIGMYHMFFGNIKDEPDRNGIGPGSAAEKRLFRYALARLAPYPNVLWDSGIDIEYYRGNRANPPNPPWDSEFPAWVDGFVEYFKRNDPWHHPVSSRDSPGPISSLETYRSKGGEYPQNRMHLVNNFNSSEVPIAFTDHYRPGISRGEWTNDRIRKYLWRLSLSGPQGAYADYAQGLFVKSSHTDETFDPPANAEQILANGVTYMKNLTQFFNNEIKWGWNKLQPRDGALKDEAGNPVDRNYVILTASITKEYVVYSSTGGTFGVNLTGAETLQMRWYNPRTGLFEGESITEGGDIVTFTAPTSGTNEDWVLHLYDPNVPDASPPTAAAGPDQSANELSPVTLDGRGSFDPDEDQLSFTWIQTRGTPTVTIRNANTELASFDAPEVSVNTPLTFQLSVFDGTFTDSDEVVVTIVPTLSTNHPPIAAAGSDQSVDERTTITLDGRGSSDPDGNPLTYIWTQIEGTPIVSLNNPNTAQASFEAPDVSEHTSLTFQLIVNDGRLDSNPDIVVITIRHINRPPVAAAGEDRTVNEQTLVILDGRGSNDLDGDELSTTWTQTNGDSVGLLEIVDSGRVSFTAPDVDVNT